MNNNTKQKLNNRTIIIMPKCAASSIKNTLQGATINYE